MHGIRVNAIAPGYVETELNRDFLRSPAGESMVKRVAMRRFGKPDDLDGALLLLASDAGRYMTGATITVDGGHSLAWLIGSWRSTALLVAPIGQLGAARMTKAVPARLAAILAADAAGYSRLMEADERATLQALDAARATFRSEVEANHGRVINTAGDSVLAVFDSAAGAVSAALAIQRALEASSRDHPRTGACAFASACTWAT